MLEAESMPSDAGFVGTYRRLVESYRLDPEILADQLWKIMQRIEPKPDTGSPERPETKRKGGELHS